MQIVENSIPGKKIIFESILDEVPGGVSLKVTLLDNLTHNANVDKRFLPAGTPIYVDLTERTADVAKSSTALTGSTAQAIKVAKNNHWKVADIFNDGVTSATIDSITTSEDTYDTINVDAALVYALGTEYGQGSVTGTSTALKYSPNALTKSEAWIYDGNADVGAVVMGRVREDALTFPINALYLATLQTGGTLITLV